MIRRAGRFDFVRREVLAAIVLAPLLARAQAPQRRKRLGILSRRPYDETRAMFGPVLEALARRGYAEGKLLELLVSSASGSARLPARAHDLVAWGPDVILTQGTIATSEAQRATQTIPIVTSVADPVASGYAKSLSRPGSNITGFSQGAAEVAAKTVEIVKLLVPGLRRLAIIHSPEVPAAMQVVAHPEAAARAAGIESVLVPSPQGRDIGRLLRGLGQQGFQAGVWMHAYGDDDSVARESIRARFPLVSGDESLVEKGMLASLSADSSNDADRVAALIEMIFNGANPADIPIQFPQRFRFVVNRRTATLLGLKLGPDLLLRADRVID